MSELTLPKPQAVIFDWDNTLVDTWPIIHAAMEETFREMGQEPWTLEQTRMRVGKSMRDSFPDLFGERWQEAGDVYQRHYRANHLSRLQALPEAARVLDRIRERGLHCMVVSNKKGNTLRQEIAHMGWGGYFAGVVGADDAARDKPFADPVHLALDKSGITPNPAVWFIGDSEVDLECALNTGCTAILYGESAKEHPQYTQTHYKEIPYHAHVHGHEDVLGLLA